MNGASLKLTCLGCLLLGLMISGLLLDLPHANAIDWSQRINTFVGLLIAGLATYLAAVWLVLRQPMSRHAIWVVLGVALTMRATLLPAPPFLSSDIYRYVWDGQVQAAGINPYRFVPADPALAGLRHLAVFSHINRADYARTIYPPAAQMIFGLVGHISPTVIGMKIVMAVFELMALLCLLRLLSIARLPRERILIYAWNPLVLWSFAGDGHVDAAAIGLLAVALLCRAGHRVRLAAAFLAGAALVKFLPVVVAPALARSERLWWALVTGAAVIVLLYAPYLSVGVHVLGFLPTYGVEEGIGDGGGFWLLAGLSRLTALPRGAVTIYILCVAVGLGLLALRIFRGRAANEADDVVMLCRDTAILAAFATVALSPHYAWYFAWLALPSVVAPLPAVIWLSSAPVALFIDPFHDRFFWPSVVYLPAAALTLAALWQRRHRPHAAIAASQGAQ
jgi:hypothetical protein